jgi:hypothetical protein
MLITRTIIVQAVSKLPAHTGALRLRSDSYVTFRISQFVVTVMFGTCSLTSVVSQITCIRVQVEGQAGAQFQSHSGEVLVVGELPVARHGRSVKQRSLLQAPALHITTDKLTPRCLRSHAQSAPSKIAFEEKMQKTKTNLYLLPKLNIFICSSCYKCPHKYNKVGGGGGMQAGRQTDNVRYINVTSRRVLVITLAVEKRKVLHIVSVSVWACVCERVCECVSVCVSVRVNVYVSVNVCECV